MNPENIRIWLTQFATPDLGRTENAKLDRDIYVYGCAFVGEVNGLTVRVDPVKVRLITEGNKHRYEYEA